MARSYDIVVIGDDDWQPQSTLNVRCIRRFEDVTIRLHNHELQFLEHEVRWNTVHGVIWRGQFDESPVLERHLLEVISASGVPCINAAESLLCRGSRVASQTTLRARGLPVVGETLLGGRRALASHSPTFPTVLKIGELQMGYGKALCRDRECFDNLVDVAGITKDVIALESFIPYRRDLRCLYINRRMTATERVPSQWRANVAPRELRRVNLPIKLRTSTANAAAALGASIVGLDWLQLPDDSWIILEANLSPGLDSAQKARVLEILRHEMQLSRKPIRPRKSTKGPTTT